MGTSSVFTIRSRRSGSVEDEHRSTAVDTARGASVGFGVSLRRPRPTWESAGRAALRPAQSRCRGVPYARSCAGETRQRSAGRDPLDGCARGVPAGGRLVADLRGAPRLTGVRTPSIGQRPRNGCAGARRDVGEERRRPRPGGSTVDGRKRQQERCRRAQPVARARRVYGPRTALASSVLSPRHPRRAVPPDRRVPIGSAFVGVLLLGAAAACPRVRRTCAGPPRCQLTPPVESRAPPSGRLRVA